MRLIVNGEKKDLKDGTTIAQLLKTFAPGIARVAVLVNDTVVTAERRASHALKDGDRVEILTFAGGG